MQLSEIFRLVIINIKQNKFKVFLTSLGIIVGASTIVMVIAIGEGGKQDVQEQFKTLNAGTITVTATDGGIMGMMDGMKDRMMMSGSMPSGSMGGPSSGGGGSSAGSSSGRGSISKGSSGFVSATTATLSEEELEDILYFVPDIATGAILATTNAEALSDTLEEAITYPIVGTQSSYEEISNLSILMGSFLTDYDEENLTRCVILGYNVASEMFDSIADAYDSKVEIDGRTYVVNGILAAMGTVVSGVNPDDAIFMPYTTADKYLLDRNAQPQFSILASDVDAVATVIENIELVLTQSNPNIGYQIEDAGATMDAAMQSANTLSLLLLAVAIIVFIVGGIGIMNVLFVSVKERTREIGILKALGTKKGNILLLFLVEAGMIGVVGGILGILISFGAVPLLVYVDITAVLTVPSIILAFLFAVLTGTVFGFYPALKASNLVPIEALNNE